MNYQAARLGSRCARRGGFHLDVDFGALRLIDEHEIEVGFADSIPTMRGRGRWHDGERGIARVRGPLPHPSRWAVVLGRPPYGNRRGQVTLSRRRLEHKARS